MVGVKIILLSSRPRSQLTSLSSVLLQVVMVAVVVVVVGVLIKAA